MGNEICIFVRKVQGSQLNQRRVEDVQKGTTFYRHNADAADYSL